MENFGLLKHRNYLNNGALIRPNLVLNFNGRKIMYRLIAVDTPRKAVNKFETNLLILWCNSIISAFSMQKYLQKRVKKQ